MDVKLNASERTDVPVRHEGPHVIEGRRDATRGAMSVLDLRLPHRQHHRPGTGGINRQRLVAEDMAA